MKKSGFAAKKKSAFTKQGAHGCPWGAIINLKKNIETTITLQRKCRFSPNVNL